MIARLAQTAQRLLFRTATITEISEINPHMRQFRMMDASLPGLSWQPGQHIRLALSQGIPLLRTYSVRRYDAEQGIIDLWVLLHGQGPGAQWAGTARAGDVVHFLGPTGAFVLPHEEASSYLFVGEETAAVTFQAMLEALPASATVYGCLETRQPGEEVPGSSAHSLTWVYRGDAPAASSAVLLAGVQSLKLPSPPGIAYLAGEARTCQAIGNYLRTELNWPRTAIRTKAYWTPGKTGLD